MNPNGRAVLVVTNHVPPDRRGAFLALHARRPVELALFGGRSHHATAGTPDPGVPHRHVTQREILGLAARGDHAAVLCGTAGRIALPAAYAGARRAGVPFVLWNALWAPVRTPAHRLAAPLLRHVARHADAVVTYGPHASAYARTLGARRPTVAPQAVDVDFWSTPAPDPVPRTAPFVAAFVGRAAPGKGLDVLLAAWRALTSDRPDAVLHLLGPTAEAAGAAAGPDGTPAGVRAHGTVDAVTVRNFLGGCDVLVLPSVPTPAFREPWGLVANEAMLQGLPVIATDAVGAAAGGLVRDGRNGHVVPAGDPVALAHALATVRDAPTERERHAGNARRDAAAFTFAAWAAGIDGALHDAHAGFAVGRPGRTGW